VTIMDSAVTAAHSAVAIVHFVVPEGIDDPGRPSGGNIYDRRVSDGLRALGWDVPEHAVPGCWPDPDAPSGAALAATLARIPDSAVVVVDGLIASAMPDVLVPAARRLRLVVLVHMPLGLATDVCATERSVLSASAGVITTSQWTRDWVIDRYGLAPEGVHAAEPGVDTADPAPGSGSGKELLCVAAVAPHKGHDVLLSALAKIADVPWRCTCVGSLSRDPDFVEALRGQAHNDGIADRVRFVGARTGADLDAAYAAADLLVLASPAETYGMVVIEALARGVPALAVDVGGVPEALGRDRFGHRPGVLVPAGDAGAFAAALRDWLSDVDLRRHLRRAALDRRETLTGWSTTSDRIAGVLAQVARVAG
jgi:glycosyltransferase involved in cell wall biosynthesis